MRDRRLAVPGHGVGDGGEDCELFADRSGVVGIRAAQRPRRRQLGDEELGPRPLVELGIRRRRLRRPSATRRPPPRAGTRSGAHRDRTGARRTSRAGDAPGRQRSRRACGRRGTPRSRRRRRGRRATRGATRRPDQGWPAVPLAAPPTCRRASVRRGRTAGRTCRATRAGRARRREMASRRRTALPGPSARESSSPAGPTSTTPGRAR